MPVVHVTTEADKVILVLPGRRRDLLLAPLSAALLADALEEQAQVAIKEAPSLYRGEHWGVYITNRDRLVVLAFTPPLGCQAVDRVPIPVPAVKKIVDLLRTNANLAGHGLRIETGA